MKIEEFLEKKKEQDSIVMEYGKQVLFPLLKDFFNKVPEVKAVRWEQCTPYFNDGDPCVFGANMCNGFLLEDDGPSSVICKKCGTEYPLSMAEKYCSEDGKRLPPAVSEDWKEPYDLEKSIQDACEDLTDVINSGEIEGVLQAAFGDHVVVTVTHQPSANAAGDELVFTVDEYTQHD